MNVERLTTASRLARHLSRAHEATREAEQRICDEVSESLTRALGGIDLRTLGERPEPRFRAPRPRKPRRPAATDLPGQLRLPFGEEVKK